MADENEVFQMIPPAVELPAEIAEEAADPPVEEAAPINDEEGDKREADREEEEEEEEEEVWLKFILLRLAKS